jgi:hypothetical protein
MCGIGASSGFFRRWRLWFFFGILVCVVSLADSQNVNIITNGGFEVGTNGWFILNGQLTTTGFVPHSGNAAGSAMLYTYGSVGQNVLGELETGQTYTWSAFLRSVDGTPNISMYLNQTDAGGTRSNLLETKPLTTTWIQYSTTFALTATGEVRDVSVSFNADLSGANILLDDISITRSSPHLSLSRSNQFVLLSWAASATNYSLQITTNLSAPMSWVTVMDPVQSNATVFSVTLPMTNRSAYFRLRR